MISVKAKCNRCNFKKDDFRILSWSPIGKCPNEIKLSQYWTFSTKGNDSYIDEGKEYDLELEVISNDDRYGSCCKIISVPSMTKLDFSKLTRDESYDILMNITTSPRLANNILDAYPNFIEKILTEGKESIDLSLISGVGDAYLNAYARDLNEKYKYYEMVQEFKDYKLDVKACKILCDIYGSKEEIVKQLEKDPYHVLILDLEMSFKKADVIILETRPNFKNSEIRCSYFVHSILLINEDNGNTRLSGADLYNYALNEYNYPEFFEKLNENDEDIMIVKVIKESELFYYDEESTDVSIASTYYAEVKIAQLIEEKTRNSHVLDINCSKYREVDGFMMTDEQFSLLDNFCNYDITILKGKAGSGKTSSVKALVKLMEENGLSFTLLAPTGASALRLTEQTHRTASTIHRKVLRDEIINTDVVIFDEFGMVSLDVFMMAINAITNPNCKIVLCGDPYQLPSIGKGCVFSDIINSNVIPTSELTKVFRYDTSGGAFVGENIRIGKSFFNDERIKHKDNIYSVLNNYKFIETEDIFDNVIAEYAKLRKKYKDDEIIVLSPYNVGDCGSFKLNAEIENEFNPPTADSKSLSYKHDNTTITFRVNSRVVNTKNDYKALPLESYVQMQESDGFLTEDDVETTQLFNGQLGVVREVEDDHLVCQFNEELIVIPKTKLQNLLLGRAISTHRSQGGEWKAVINVVSKKHSRLLSKQLLYVADTRMKEFHCDIGDTSAMEDALRVDVIAERFTWLKELIDKQFSENTENIEKGVA